MAAPMHTMMWVRIPAARPLAPRSVPIRPPSTAASSSRNTVDKRLFSCNKVKKCAITPLPVLKMFL